MTTTVSRLCRNPCVAGAYGVNGLARPSEHARATLRCGLELGQRRVADHRTARPIAGQIMPAPPSVPRFHPTPLTLPSRHRPSRVARRQLLASQFQAPLRGLACPLACLAPVHQVAPAHRLQLARRSLVKAHPHTATSHQPRVLR